MSDDADRGSHFAFDSRQEDVVNGELTPRDSTEKSEPTPGPWTAQRNAPEDMEEFFVTANENRDVIAGIGFCGKHTEANAALIARAPEMAEEIERLKGELRNTERNSEMWYDRFKEAEAQRDELLGLLGEWKAALDESVWGDDIRLQATSIPAHIHIGRLIEKTDAAITKATP